jgi:hypothetical protein
MTNDKEQLAQNATNTTKRGQQCDDANHRQQFSQPDTSELITHFVSFLKSLAMRMNAETVQFFSILPQFQ